MESEGFFHRPSSSTLSSCCFFAYQPSSLAEIHSSDARNSPFGTDMRHLEALASSKSVRAVLGVASGDLNELACDEAAISNGGRYSFADSPV